VENLTARPSTGEKVTKTEDYPLTGEGVWLDLKLNAQCPNDETASGKLSVLMRALQHLMCREAKAVVDELVTRPAGQAEQLYRTSRKMRITNDGVCVYLRLEVTTTRVMTYPELVQLVEHIVSAFTEQAQRLALTLDQHGSSVLKMAFAGLGDLLLDPDSTLSDLIGTGLSQLGGLA